MGWLQKFINSIDVTYDESTGAIRTQDDSLVNKIVEIVNNLLATIFKSEIVTKKAYTWTPITSGLVFAPPSGTNGITIATKSAITGAVVSGTVWVKPSASNDVFRIAKTFSFNCSTATLKADGYTDVMQGVDITGMSYIKVVFTGGELAYVPY